ncbi:28 kDa heat- and acid-stable phosphoprotein [Drosophila novamexicana]|uniref:28 kDa heat- and acid-stable phosphoprotein n=1 Tax=Drosophila novamexicana TaxID=47314 RepID=UPI0011E5B8EE|nr:28 kDa heat- and acid-stable phosphoprotein [Drosophila novamexicana]
MPRGKYVNHKGRSRHFTSPEELQQESEEESDQSTGSETEEQAGSAGTSKQPAGTGGSAAARKSSRPAAQRQKQQQQQRRSSSDEESDDDDSDDDSEADQRDAKKGVAALIEIENPNRVTKKATQKLSQIKIDDVAGAGGGGSGAGGGSTNTKPELSRREREQIEKQKARQRYEKLHAAGKTTEAKADLARLALIRQQREEAAAKREAEKKSVADLSKKPLTK